MLAALAAVRAMGQPWWCACGQTNLWASDIWSSHCSQHLIDPYAITHVSHGLLFAIALAVLARRWPLSFPMRMLIATGIECAWEVLENSPFVIDRYRAATISLNYMGDSVANVAGDILACALGVAIAHRLGWRVALGLFVVTEIALLVAIRDNLTLNVLMLAWPIDAVKQWQSVGQGV